ncbi:L-fucose:H+ symporter permease [Cytophagaceae bacterium DM2B3-1]|uniref:L-fucose:H+ symporter permease n=1 Tax=Xanthocytophaga flava TaxID=3048013 RepID=A0ABT7CWP7_9BACT|nr:L-fucose:H+ symporter permease [Xanthocytophaga flavus]MDJ1498145.1 L-fucose:H+ symporter permease [Xanthocytophaga flavus]
MWKEQNAPTAVVSDNSRPNKALSESSTNTYLVPFILMTTLFFMWGFAHNLNPILIPHLKKACQLTDFQSAMIDSAFFVGYFAMAIPAGIVMKKYGYKAGIIGGLILFAIGAFLFVPAANVRIFGFFLTALFIIASGLTFLETAANPYVTVLGEKEGASQRINLAQSFNGLGASMGALIGGRLILSGNNLTEAEKTAMSPDQLNTFLTEEASSVKLPYIVIGFIVLSIAIILYRTRLPEIKEDNHEIDLSSGNKSIWRHKHLMWGVLAQFFYVGGQVCVSSFFIRYLYQTAHIEEQKASDYLSAALLVFMVGRFVGTFLMKYIAPQRLLTIYAVMNLILLTVVVSYGGMVSLFALIGVEFFMSIMFPTIFSLSIQSLKEETKMGSSLLIMSIVGGAIFPLIMGHISDISSIQTAYIVPLLCFIVIFYFGWKGHKVRA